jgi:lantibiotic modifying enzyme
METLIHEGRQRRPKMDVLAYAAQRLQLVDEIDQTLRTGTFDSADLGSGLAGPLIFYAELFNATQRAEYLEQARRKLDAIFDSLEQMTTFDLYGGLAGVAWALNHVRSLEHGKALGLADDCCEEVDSLLLELTAAQTWTHHFELISGLVGVGAYALEHPDRSVRTALFSRVVTQLEAVSEREGDGVTWRSQNHFLPNPSERIRFPNGLHNLGIAHGVPGVIALYGKALRRGITDSRLEPMLRQALTWLLSVSNSQPELSYGFVAGDLIHSRIAWCYGNLSVAIALIQAAQGLADEVLMSKALALATTTIERPMWETGVEDASLCHGSFGNAHIYHRIYQLSGKRRFLAASRRWQEVATHSAPEMRKESGLLFPFRMRDEWKQDLGYLMGLSGIGLVAAQDIFPLSGSWDAPLFTDFSS